MGDESLDELTENIPKHFLPQLQTLLSQARESGKPLCVLTGGETVVTVRGGGVGGRNQELVLSAAIHSDARQPRNQCLKNFSVSLLSAGTDGIDGPTPAAGAIVTQHTAAEAHKQHLDMRQFLDDNDSYNSFRKLNEGANHVITGHTGTNVMDMQILLIQAKVQK